VGYLVLQCETEGDIPTRVITVDAPGASTAVQVCVDKSHSREGHQVETVIETKMIASDPGKRNLEEIASRRNLHHRSDREISINVVVSVECESEHSIIDGSSRESQVAAESPSVFVSMGQSYR